MTGISPAPRGILRDRVKRHSLVPLSYSMNSNRREHSSPKGNHIWSDNTTLLPIFQLNCTLKRRDDSAWNAWKNLLQETSESQAQGSEIQSIMILINNGFLYARYSAKPDFVWGNKWHSLFHLMFKTALREKSFSQLHFADEVKDVIKLANGP